MYDNKPRWPLATYNLKTTPKIDPLPQGSPFEDGPFDLLGKAWSAYYEDVHGLSEGFPDNLFIVTIRPYALDRRGNLYWFDETTLHIWHQGKLVHDWVIWKANAAPPPVPDAILRLVDPELDAKGPLLDDFIEDVEGALRHFYDHWRQGQKDHPDQHWPDRLPWPDWFEQFVEFYRDYDADEGAEGIIRALQAQKPKE